MAISLVDGFVGSLKRRKKSSIKRVQMYQPTIGEDLDIVKQDHVVKTHPANNRNRRTLVLKKENDSWGFTLQSYGIHHRSSSEIEDLTYVDYVEINGPAFLAGMRKGDIILSVNGTTTEEKSHKDLVSLIKTCGDTMRLVVLFEDCSRKVDLHLRYLKLKKLLAAKEFELNSIDEKLSRLQRGEKLSNTHRLGSVPSTSCTNLQEDRWSLIPRARASVRTERPASVCGTNLSQHPPGYSSLPRGGAQKPTKPVLTPTKPVHKHPELDTGHKTEDQAMDMEEVTCSSEQNDSKVVDVPTASEPLPVDTRAVGGPEQFHSLPIRNKNRPKSLLLSQNVNVKQVPKGLSRSSSTSMQNLTQITASNTTNDSQTPSPSESSAPGRSFLSRRHSSRSSSRSRSFRSSFRHSMSPASGESYQESSNYVLTEENCRRDTEPTLLRLKQGNMDFRNALAEQKKSPKLSRSVSSPQVKHLVAKLEGKSKHSERSEKCVTADSLRRSQSTSTANTCSPATKPIITVTPPRRPDVALGHKSDSHINAVCHVDEKSFKTGNTEQLDKNGNPIQHVQCLHLTSENDITRPQRSRSNEHLPREKSCSAGTAGKSRPWSTGSDLMKVSRTFSKSSTGSGSSGASRSLSRSSSGSGNGASSPESGCFEFYADPFTPSPEDLPDQEFPFSPKITDTPIMNPLKKLSKRILTYSRHKEVIKHEFQLMNINEEEEVTRL